MYSKSELQSIFQAKFNCETWQEMLKSVFSAKQDLRTIQSYEQVCETENETGYHLGKIVMADNLELGLFYYKINTGSVVTKRVGLRQLVHTFSKYMFDAVLAVFDDGENWRVSFISDIKGEATAPKRYTFVFGDTDSYYHTAFERFDFLQKNEISLKNLFEAFNVEKLSKEFFDNYKSHYLLFCKYLLENKSYKTFLKLDNDYKEIRDFCKKLLGRIVFLYFLQKKGWLGANDENYSDGDKNFLYNFFKKSGKSEIFYSEYLQKLFFYTLNKKRKNDNFTMPDDEAVKIPFLNGGLFENEFSFNESINFSTELFTNLFDFFDQYNFTVYEDDPHDHTVAVDPEMLGHIFENLLEDNKDKGAFYTPKEIVHYMCKESLKEYCLNCDCSDSFDYNDYKAIVEALFNQDVDIQNHINQTTHSEIIVRTITEKLDAVKICDPAIGSGAFPMGLLQEIFTVKQTLNATTQTPAEIKLQIIQNSIYGVDIEKGAVDIARLRFWLSLIIDEEKPRALPNLDYKIMQGNSLIESYEGVELTNFATGNDLKIVEQMERDLFGNLTDNQMKMTIGKTNLTEDVQKKMKKYFSASGEEKQKLKKEIDQTVYEFIDYNLELRENSFVRQISELEYLSTLNSKQEKALNKLQEDKAKIQDSRSQLIEFQNKNEKPFFLWHLFFKDVFDNGGFDIVIGNPPYVSTKGISAEDKKLFEQAFGFADDTYNHFFFKGIDLLKPNGVITYIIPKTFWTTQTKRNLRDLLLSKNVKYIFDTANPFESAMVDTCIISAKNCNQKNNQILFLDGKESLAEPKQYLIDQNIYLNTQNSVIFKPTPENLKIYELYGEKVKKLYNQWWDKIKTSADIAKNSNILEEYRNNLKAGDIALLGCLTEGGQGLATANNGKYIAVRKSTKWAKNILLSRPKKLAEAIKEKKIQIAEMADFSNTTDFLESLSEKEIAELFDKFKEQYGRDIFGQGYIYRLVEDSEIADVDTLTEDEKQNGISETKNYYVPYDKGDKDGNRWYLETPFAIAWSQKNVGFLKADPKARYQGYLFYFKEGFCWSDINTTFLKCRKKQKSINDVKSMSLYSKTGCTPEYYIVCLINSYFMSYYVDDFVNNTQTFQINDARQLPIIVPTKQQSDKFEELFDCATKIKKAELAKQISENEAEIKLNDIQKMLDDTVRELYGF